MIWPDAGRQSYGDRLWHNHKSEKMMQSVGLFENIISGKQLLTGRKTLQHGKCITIINTRCSTTDRENLQLNTQNYIAQIIALRGTQLNL